MSDEPRFGWQFDRDPEPPVWADWPCCPRCRAPRETVCPTCNVPRADFPLADPVPAAEFLPALDAVDESPDRQRRGGECCGGGGALVCSSDRDEATPGDDDAAADALPPASSSPGSGEGPAVLLVCPTCDEAFSPRFYRWCENCGYDFGYGREGGPPEEPAANYRVVLALVALVALLGGLWAYLIWLFRE